MNIDNLAIYVGIFFTLIVLISRIIKLKKKFLDKMELFASLSYILLAYISGVAIVQMINLAVLTISDKLTLELITQNKVYIFFAWIIIAFAVLISFISMIIEDKKIKKKKNKSKPNKL